MVENWNIRICRKWNKNFFFAIFFSSIFLQLFCTKVWRRAYANWQMGSYVDVKKDERNNNNKSKNDSTFFLTKLFRSFAFRPMSFVFIRVVIIKSYLNKKYKSAFKKRIDKKGTNLNLNIIMITQTMLTWALKRFKKYIVFIYSFWDKIFIIFFAWKPSKSPFIFSAIFWVRKNK